LLPETTLPGAMDVAARLRRAVADIAMPASGLMRDGEVLTGAFGTTASLGVAARTAGEVEFLDLLARADAALYQAKANGRDRVESG
jgi:diguanylate cyclase (GGDEF)-like protein